MKNNTSSLNKITRQKETTVCRNILLQIALPALLLTSVSAQAASYNFPGVLPAVCSVVPDSINKYTCGILMLGDDDTITLTYPITITFNGAFTTGKRNLINTDRLASDLTLVVNGALNVGENSTLIANVTGVDQVNIGANSKILGAITTTGTGGIVTIGNDVEVGGNVNAQTGAINIGEGGKVHGHIIANVGVVTLGANTKIDGNIVGGAGAVNTGADVILGGTSYGTITTTEGVVTIGATNKTGNITTGAGAVNIGDNSSICGDISVTGAGVTTLTSNVKVDGGISNNAGAVTVGNSSMIRDDVIVTGAGVITMTSVNVGGNISAVNGAITLTNSTVGGTVPAGVVTLTNSSAKTISNDLTLSDACGYVPAKNPVLGTDGKDTLLGTASNDSITGKGSADTLTGGLGADQFVYTNTKDRADTIKDFTQGIIIDPLDPLKYTFNLMVKDKIVLTSLLQNIGYQGVDPIGDGWVILRPKAFDNSITVTIDPHGTTPSQFALAKVTTSGDIPSRANFSLSVADFIF